MQLLQGTDFQYFYIPVMEKQVETVLPYPG